MTTAAQIITRVRYRLAETTAKFWSDPELLAWLNEALRDAGRFTRHIRDTKTVSVTGSIAEYTLSSDVIEVDEVYYLPGDGRSIPLTGQSYDNLNAQWGQWQNSYVGEPRVYALWGTPPTLKIKLYPTPEASASLSLLVVRMPAQCASTSATVDFPPQWEDLLEDYMEMAALRKARDSRWQEAFQMYTAKRDNLHINGAYSYDPDTFVFDGAAGVLPAWLVYG